MAVSFLIFIDNGALLSGRPQVTPTTCYILPKQTLPVIGTYAAGIVGWPLVKAKADILQGNNLSKFLVKPSTFSIISPWGQRCSAFAPASDPLRSS